MVASHYSKNHYYFNNKTLEAKANVNIRVNVKVWSGFRVSVRVRLLFDHSNHTICIQRLFLYGFTSVGKITRYTTSRQLEARPRPETFVLGVSLKTPSLTKNTSSLQK